jgi:hypothetical protein
LINFKRGAFVGGLSIWPKVHKWSSRFQSSTTGVIDGLPHYLIGGCCLWNSCTKIELPVFRPNEFFWKNHQLEGEEKWETYSRVIRLLMSEVGDIPMLDCKIEEKFEYKKILYPKKSASKKTN